MDSQFIERGVYTAKNINKLLIGCSPINLIFLCECRTGDRKMSLQKQFAQTYEAQIKYKNSFTIDFVAYFDIFVNGNIEILESI